MECYIENAAGRGLSGPLRPEKEVNLAAHAVRPFAEGSLAGAEAAEPALRGETAAVDIPIALGAVREPDPAVA